MAKRVGFTDQAKADLRAIDRETALQILKTLARFVLRRSPELTHLYSPKVTQAF